MKLGLCEASISYFKNLFIFVAQNQKIRK